MSKGGGPKETEYDKELASISSERESDYQKTFVPLEKYISAKTLSAQPDYQKEAQGTSNANYQAQFGLAQPTVVNQEGQRQTGGNFAPRLGTFANDRGTATALGSVDTNLGSQRRFLGNLQGLSDLGAGKETNAINSLNSVGQTSQNQAIVDARASAAAGNAIRQGVGTAAGFGLGAYQSGFFNSPTSTNNLSGYGLNGSGQYAGSDSFDGPG